MLATLGVIVFAGLMALCTVASLYPKNGEPVFPATHTVEPPDDAG